MIITKKMAMLEAALRSCVAVMDRDLNGLALIQPELKEAKQALEDMYLVDAEVEPWNGEGLPPVETVCEWAGCTFAPEDPEEPDLHVGDQVRVIAHFKDGEMDLAAFTFNPQIHNADRGTAWVNQGAHGCFRPIRTPEQIEAEERDKAIDELAGELGGHWSKEAKDPQRAFAAYLYDIGYRKQVQP